MHLYEVEKTKYGFRELKETIRITYVIKFTILKIFLYILAELTGLGGTKLILFVSAVGFGNG